MTGSNLMFKSILMVVLSVTVLHARARGEDVETHMHQPSWVEACNAWREHISGLLDQHRIAGDMDNEVLFSLVRQFIAARDACTPASYEAGLRMYEGMAVGRAQRPLR